MKNILIVEDDRAVNDLLKQFLEAEGYRCASAADTAEGRLRLGKNRYDLIICDITMPGESGLDFIRFALSESQDVATIMVTAVDDPLVANAALDIGAYDYMIKPVDRNELIIGVANALRRQELEITNRTYRENLEQKVLERTATLQETMNRLRKALDGVIRVIASTVEIRDPYTAGHQRRVADCARAIATEMGSPKNQIEGIRLAGVIHDLGKIAVPKEILTKPTRLSKIEYELIKTHPQIGYEILQGIEFPWPIAEMVRQHHERIDGSGYPLGLSEKDILLEAKVLAVADVVEAMASHRPYRPGLGIERALQELSDNRKILYDPGAVDACVRLFRERGYFFKDQ